MIAYNDLMAIGAMRAIRASGRTVPGDISVVGFDDVAIAAYTDPPLTTIAQAIGELGRWAVERLVERLSDDAAMLNGGEPASRARSGTDAAGAARGAGFQRAASGGGTRSV